MTLFGLDAETGKQLYAVTSPMKESSDGKPQPRKYEGHMAPALLPLFLICLAKRWL